MQKWKRVEPTVSHKVGWRTVISKTFVMPNGNEVVFDTLGSENEHHTAVIALTDQNQVIVARQFRTGPEKIMDELPGGTVDPGEDLKIATEREFSEETGYQAEVMEYLGSHNKDAYMNATWHCFLATGCKLVGKPKLEDDETIETHLISIDELIDNAKHNRMTDVTAVFMAYDRLGEILKQSDAD